jgi:hypothetical protein
MLELVLPVAGFTESGSRSRHFAESVSKFGSRPRFFRIKKISWIKKRPICLLKPLQRTFGLQEKPPVQQRTCQTLNFDGEQDGAQHGGGTRKFTDIL